MKKLSVIGLDIKKEKVLSELMELGAVQITQRKMQGEGKEMELTGKPVSRPENDKLAQLEYQLNDVALALESLEKYSPEKSPLFFTRRAMKEWEFEDVLSKRDAILGNVRGVLQLRDDLHRLNEERNRLLNDLNAVGPWTVYDLPLNLTETEYTDIDIGILPSKLDIDALRERAEKVDEAVVVKEINRDKDFIYLVTATMKDTTEDVMTVLKQSGFSSAEFKGFNGTALENRADIEKRIVEKELEIKETEAKIAGRHGEIREIECLYDQLVIRRDREAIKEDLSNTKRTFYFEGWVPEPKLKKLGKILDREDCVYETRDPEEDEKVPVYVQNRASVYPFEAITDMYSLPDYHGIDPTSFFALFYAMFFGMMLSDAGYGLVISIVTFIWLKKFDLEGMKYKMIKMFFYCGLATVFWGAMFGGWFGDFVHVAGKVIFNKDVNLGPVWFDPIKDPTKLLIFSLFLGIIHIFLGMGIKAYMLIKRGHFWDAVFDIFTWYAIITGAVVWVVGGKFSPTVSKVGKYMFFGGLIVLLLTGGRKKKGFGKVIGGFGAVYDITGYASDILSYSRLLALGLATGVIAQVVNTIGSLSGPGIKGTIILLIVFVIGHVFNLAINALGAFVHSSRLQYIEFFGKFYEDGGEEFEPFRKNTKYVRLLNNRMEVEND